MNWGFSSALKSAIIVNFLKSRSLILFNHLLADNRGTFNSLHLRYRDWWGSGYYMTSLNNWSCYLSNHWSWYSNWGGYLSNYWGGYLSNLSYHWCSDLPNLINNRSNNCVSHWNLLDNSASNCTTSSISCSISRSISLCSRSIAKIDLWSGCGMCMCMCESSCSEADGSWWHAHISNLSAYNSSSSN